VLFRSIQACQEALRVYGAEDHQAEYAEVQTILWAAFSALAEVEEKAENCKRAVQACEEALQIYAESSPQDFAEAQKNLGYSLITLAELEEKTANCKRAIDAYDSALRFYILRDSPLELAEVLRDLAFAYFTLSSAEGQIEFAMKAMKNYKKASRIYSGIVRDLEAEGDPGAAGVRELAEGCLRSMESCRRILKASRKAGRSVPHQRGAGKI
jgi:tetratricopeptide (TPR) repeat protein